MSRNLVSLLVILICLLFTQQLVRSETTSNSTIYETHSVPVSSGYTQAIDAAVFAMTTDISFQKEFAKLMLFSVPQCTSGQTFPTINPFIGRKALVMCIELGAIYPFGDAKQLVARTIVKKINENYGTNYETQIRIMDTAKLGFFTTMKSAVDNGECDVITTNVQFTDERRKLIHFQCAWGSTSKGFLRTELDPQLTLTSFSSLNQSGLSVSAYKGTTYEADVLTLTQAHYVPLNNSDEQYDLILRKQIHAAVDNSVTLITWLDNNRKSCQNCTVYFIGQPYPFATFTTNLISGIQILSAPLTFMASLLFIIMTIF